MKEKQKYWYYTKYPALPTHENLKGIQDAARFAPKKKGKRSFEKKPS